jgi:hypothetical protein
MDIQHIIICPYYCDVVNRHYLIINYKQTNTMKNLEVLKINVGESIDYKFGLITYDIYKVKNGLYELTDTSSGWVNCRINEQKLTDLLQGKISMLNLNWK